MCNNILEEAPVKGGRVVVEYEEYPDNPREWASDDLILYLAHGRYNLAQETTPSIPRDDFDTVAEWEDALRAHYTDYDLVPVYGYDHGSLTLRLDLPYSCPWDSGQAGIALVRKGANPEIVKSEIEQYVAYLNGWVYYAYFESEDGVREAGYGGFTDINEAIALVKSEEGLEDV